MTVQYSPVVIEGRDQRKAVKRQPQLQQATEIGLNIPKIIEIALAEWNAEEGTPLTIAQVCAHIRADNEKLESSQKLADLHGKAYSFTDRNGKTVTVSPTFMKTAPALQKRPDVTKEKSPFDDSDFYGLF
jgi:hypothetical protein